MQILRDLDGVGRDDFAVDLLGAEGHSSVIEAGMADRKDKAASRFHDLTNTAHQGIDLGHIHDSLEADCGIKTVHAKGEDLDLTSGIDQTVLDPVGLFSSAKRPRSWLTSSSKY